MSAELASPPRSTRLLVVALILCVLAYEFGITMVTPVLDAIGRGVGAATGTVGASQTLFFLAGGVSSLVAVRLSDYLGRKRVLLAILVACFAGSMIIAIAPTVATVVVGRTLQGAGSALFPLSYLLLRESLPAVRFGLAVGVVSAFGGGLFGIDGLIGGALGERIGFRAVFVLLTLIGAAAIAFCAFAVPDIVPLLGRRPRAFDWAGAAILAACVVCLDLGLYLFASSDARVVLGIALLIAAPVLVVVYEFVGRRRQDPLLDLRMLRSRSIWPLMFTTFAGIAGAFAVTTYLVSLLAEDTVRGYGLSSTVTALMFLVPAGLLTAIFAPIAGHFAPRVGWAVLLRIALVASTAALALAATFESNEWIVFGALCLLGLSFNGTALPMLNGLSVLLTPPEAPGLLPALTGVCVGIGASLGVALVTPLAASASVSGYSQALWVCAGLTALAFCAALVLRERPTRARVASGPEGEPAHRTDPS